MSTIIAPKLNPGDAVGIVSPSGPVRDRELYNRGLEFLRRMGYRTVEAPHALSRFYHMAASGKDKANDIQTMFSDPSIKAIFPTVGGHTANQLIEHLDWDVIQSNPKIVFGFSDNSVLLNAIYKMTGLVCFHSLCDIVFGFGVFGKGKLDTDGRYTSTHLFKLITTAAPPGPIPPLSTWTSLRSGTAEGILVGGNLSTLRSLIGTKYEPDWDGCILFLEDSAEPHRWDQQLGHLRLAGILDRLSGLVVGRVERPDTFYPENYRPLREIFFSAMRSRHFSYSDLKARLKDFTAVGQKDSLLYPAIIKWHGMRVSTPYSLYEFLVITTLLQNTVVRRSVQMMKSLFERLGERIQFAGTELFGFWSPRDLNSLDESELRALKLGYRAKILKRQAAVFCEGLVNERQLRGLSKEALRIELLELYGVGPATVQYLLFEVFHHYDAFEYLPPWEQKIFSRLLFNKRMVNSGRILKEMNRRYGQWRMLAAHYLFEDGFWARKEGKASWLDPLIRLD